MKKNEKSQIKERNRKAASILNSIGDKELSQVSGGILIRPPGGDGCPTCGLIVSLE
jgi:hypothetical protein